MIKFNRLMHAGLIVSDLERSRAFYEGVLGLKVNPYRPNLSFEGIWYETGDDTQIHLMVVPNPYAEVERPAHGGRDYHLALSVDDVAPIREQLDAAGVAYTLSMSGRAALFCRDPDGNALEFSAVKQVSA
ncbi:MAG: VOC family protein [Methylophilaceae bacterium]